MKNIKNTLKRKNLYFSGIGGISLSALAKYSIFNKKQVLGSDISHNQYTSELESLGAKIDYFQTGELLDNNCAYIYSSAIKEDCKEFLRAKQLKIPIIKRSEMLGEIVSLFSNSIAISGSHGKTTCCAMLSEIYINAKLSPTIFLGGETKNIQNFVCGNSSCCIVEACEYKKNFLNIHPKISVVLNIDNDHLDSYNSIEDEIATFNRFISNSVAVINADDKNSKNLCNIQGLTFGINSLANYMAKNIKREGLGYSFNVYKGKNLIGRIKLKVSGKHNIYNALASIVVADYQAIPFSIIKNSIENFNGVKRRNEFIGEYYNKKVLCDYAHHPTEINALYETYKNEKDKTLFIFQPHTYSRTKILMEDFVNVLSKFNNLIIYKTYPARENFLLEGSAEVLYKNLSKINNIKKHLFFASNMEEIKATILSRFQNVNKIVFVGAGDIYDIATNIATQMA